MDQSINIPWTQGMNYGVGVNLLNGDIAGKGVEPGSIAGPTNALGQTVSYNITLLNSLEELYSAIGISVEASGHYGLFSGAGKFNYSNEVKFNTQSTFLLARCVVENAFTQCEDARLKPEAGNLIQQGKNDVFQNRFGDGFVRGMQTGGEFFAVISITSSNREEQMSVGASLRAKYGGIFASIDVETKLDDSTKSKVAHTEIRISTYQRGGRGDEQGFTQDIEAVMARLKAFPQAVLVNPVPYDVQVASYVTLALPDGPNPIVIQAQKDALEDYARILLKLLSLRNDIEFIQLHADYFENPPDILTLNDWNQALTEQINHLKRQAQTCASLIPTSELDSCPLVALTLPDGFLIPRRKAHSSDQTIIFEHANFEGRSQVLLEGRYDDAEGELVIGNDTLSSLKVSPGFTARLYEHFHFQGRFIDIREDTPAVSLAWNDRVSSIAVCKEGNVPLTKEAVIFEHINYGGVFQVLKKGRYDGVNAQLAIGNKILSSALIPNGMILRLYELQNFQGLFTEYREDLPVIAMDWNDRASSIILYEAGEAIA